MRVIAGTARSMPLRTLKGTDIRPTTDKTKETLFNIMQFRIPGCRFLDLFAGTGAIGIEALSRGASAAFFVEKDRRAHSLIAENLAYTKTDARAKLIRGDVLQVLAQLEREEPFDIIFMDPPFDQGLEKDVLTYLSDSGIPAPGGLIIAEASAGTDFSYLPDLGYEVVKRKLYTHSSHIFLRKKENEQ